MAVGVPSGQSFASKASGAFIRWAKQLIEKPKEVPARWDVTKTPGGSSGDAAATLAASMMPSAEESFANFLSQWDFPKGQAQTLRELWEAGGSPYINIDPQVQSPGKRGIAAFATMEGMPNTFQGKDFILQEVGATPTYVEEERVPVDTLNIGKRDIEDFYAELAHARQFGPEEYEYQYPEGTPYGEIPSDWTDWAQPTERKALEALAQRRAEMQLQVLTEDILHGKAKYDAPATGDVPTIEYEAHDIIEPQLEALYEEKYAPREQADKMELFLRALKISMLFMGGISQIGTGGLATGPQALLPWRRDEGEYGK